MLNAETKPNFLCLSYTKQRKNFTEKELFKEKEEWRIEKKQKTKRSLLNCHRYSDYEGPHNVNKKALLWIESQREIVRTAIKQDLSYDLNPLGYAIWGVLENKTNATSHLNMGLLKTAIEEEWNKMSEEFISKVCWYNNRKNSK